jgi:hypothetical protein
VACWGEDNDDALGFRAETPCHPYFEGFCSPTPQLVPDIANAVQIATSKFQVRSWILTDNGAVISWPGPKLGTVQARPLGGPCKDAASALASEEVVRREAELIEKRIRVRGSISERSVNQLKRASIGALTLYPLPMLDTRPEETVVVDGILVRFRTLTSEPNPLGIQLLDVCRVPKR